MRNSASLRRRLRLNGPKTSLLFCDFFAHDFSMCMSAEPVNLSLKDMIIRLFARSPMAGGFTFRACFKQALTRFFPLVLLLSLARAEAQPTIVSTDPATGADGVSTNVAVVFNFSEAMDTNQTSAQFYDGSTFALLATSPSWSAGNTVLTCTPSPGFPPDTQIIWLVSGQDVGANQLTGATSGYFTTGTGGGTGTTGTNQNTAFGIGQAIYYLQTSSAVPS
jgi:hypothetical protein